MLCRCPSAAEQTSALSAEMFSCELLGRVFRQLKQRHDSGLEVSVAVLEDLDSEEMSHITGVMHRHQGPLDEAALRDCVTVILSEHRKGNVSGVEDLMDLRKQMKERKGIR